jgi:deoxycytidylate deaminase
MLINAGVRQVIFQGDYPDELALELMNEAKMKMAIWSNGEE